jgi:hypothetical protein
MNWTPYFAFDFEGLPPDHAFERRELITSLRLRSQSFDFASIQALASCSDVNLGTRSIWP